MSCMKKIVRTSHCSHTFRLTRHTLYLAQEWAIIFTQMPDESISKRLLAASEAEKNMYNCY
jgi:hypothetical protein